MLAGVLCSAFPPETSSSCDCFDLSASLVDKPLPTGWQVRAVRGEQAPSLAVVDSAGARFLRTSGVARAAWFVRELEPATVPMIVRASAGTICTLSE